MLVEINLLGEKERDRPAFVVAAIFLILLGLVTGLVFYFLGNSFENKQQEATALSAEVVSQQVQLQEQMQTSATLNDTQKLQKTVLWAETYQFDTLPLIRELTSLLPERGFFLNFSFASPSEATIDVQFDTTREAAFYLAQLKASEMITAVILSSVTYQPLAEESGVEVDTQETVMPRYTASYAITFLDNRMPAEGTAVPEDPNAMPAEEGTPAENETPADQPADSQEPEGQTGDSLETNTQPNNLIDTEPSSPADDTEGVETNE